MSKLQWDKVGERFYETGADHGVLYRRNAQGAYTMGYAWNGLTTVTESPSGAEASPQYADNIKYLNLVSAEELGGTIEAFTSPREFDECDGTRSPVPGVSLGQQGRQTFGFCYRTLLGNDVDGNDHAYKLHLIYGALASPSEKAYATVNDSPEATPLSWEFSTTPTEVGTVNGVSYKPTSSITITSTEVDATALAALEDVLYGTAGVDPRLPLPGEVYAMFSGTLTEVAPVAPTYNNTTKVITIPATTGVVYQIDGEPVSGTVTITADTVVTAVPADGYQFPAVTDDDWYFDYTP